MRVISDQLSFNLYKWRNLTMMPDDINSLLLDIAKETALVDHRREKTVSYLAEDVPLLLAAVSKIDITTLRFGPYTNTTVAKIKDHKEVLEINGDRISERIKKGLVAKYDKMLEMIDQKMTYGEEISKFLEKKEDDLVESIKSNILEDDLAEFETIRSNLLFFKKELISLAESIEKSIKRLQKAGSVPV